MNRRSIGGYVMPVAYLVAGVILVIGLSLIAAKALAITGFEMLMGVE